MQPETKALRAFNSTIKPAHAQYVIEAREKRKVVEKLLKLGTRRMRDLYWFTKKLHATYEQKLGPCGVRLTHMKGAEPDLCFYLTAASDCNPYQVCFMVGGNKWGAGPGCGIDVGSLSLEDAEDMFEVFETIIVEAYRRAAVRNPSLKAFVEETMEGFYRRRIERNAANKEN